jgi:predicted NAD/FAD-binding protein
VEPVPRLRVAVVGGGVAGLATAWLIEADHDVTLYEAAPYLGGHARTLAVDSGSTRVLVETGFKYFTDEAYPTLIGFTRRLGLPLRRYKVSMSLARPGRGLLVLPPRSPGQVARIALSPRPIREALAFYLFLGGGEALVRGRSWRPTVCEYAESRRITASIAESFIYPFLAASWGAPLDVMPDFPAYDVLKVLRGARGKSRGFCGFEGGSSVYVAAIVRELRSTTLRPSTPVTALVSDGERWRVVDASGGVERFDRVVVATDARQAQRLLATAPQAGEHAATVGRFRYFDTRIVVHRDPSWMPAARADWCSVNFRVEGRHVWNTEWSGWREREPVFRTWMPPHRELPARVVHDQAFEHLIVTRESPTLQRRIAELQGREGLYLAGMYTTDVDDHESSLLSAANAGRMLAPRSARQLVAAGGV